VTVEFEIVFKNLEELTASELEEMNEVDHLAFFEEDGDDDWWQDWAAPTMRFLGKEDGRVVSTVGLIRREILVGGKPSRIGGIGGVATRPDRQKMGYAGKLLVESTRFMLSDTWYQYGILFCDPKRIPFYQKSGYTRITNSLYVRRESDRHLFPDPCLALDLRGLPFPEGEVDCLGLPW
jgi:GNAT superfamily N-acetyltransferase